MTTLRERSADSTADAAERHWRNGEAWHIGSLNTARKGLVRKFNQGNKEALETQTPEFKRQEVLAKFCHRESDLKPGDYFLSYNQGSPVAFQFGEIETRDGNQGVGITRLWDGSPFDLFKMNPEAKIQIVSREKAIAFAKSYREATR